MSEFSEHMGRTLYEAASRGDAGFVQQLLASAKAAGRVQNLLAAASVAYPVGDTALHAAARCGHLTVVRLLLEAGVAVDIQTTIGRTPLHDAASSNKPEVLKLLLAAGASIDQGDENSTTALYRAAKFGAVDAIQVLLQAGAAVNTRTTHGQTALHRAADNGSTAVAKALIAAGADVAAADAWGKTALNLAVQCEHPSTVQELLLGGSAVDAAGLNGVTPLSHAACSATQGRAAGKQLFACFMAHITRNPVAPAVLVKAAAFSAHHLCFRGCSCDIIRQLLSAAIQQDAAATRAALQQHWPLALHLTKSASARLACMWLDMWLAAAADQASLEAALPAVQQMVMRVAAEHSKSGKHAAVEMRV